jgi:hypothetical protein
MWGIVYFDIGDIDMKSTKQVIFGDMTLEELLQDIYRTASENRVLLTTAINDLRATLKSRQSSSEDISYIGNVISSLFDTAVKNDEHLIKLATVIQKLILTDKKGDDGDRMLLSEHEKQQLLSAAKEEMQKIKSSVDNIATKQKSILTEEKLN